MTWKTSKRSVAGVSQGDSRFSFAPAKLPFSRRPQTNDRNWGWRLCWTRNIRLASLPVFEKCPPLSRPFGDRTANTANTNGVWPSIDEGWIKTSDAYNNNINRFRIGRANWTDVVARFGRPPRSPMSCLLITKRSDLPKPTCRARIPVVVRTRLGAFTFERRFPDEYHGVVLTNALCLRLSCARQRCISAVWEIPPFPGVHASRRYFLYRFYCRGPDDSGYHAQFTRSLRQSSRGGCLQRGAN